MARILILEDNLVFAQLIRSSLAEEGHESVNFVDSSSAFEGFNKDHYDLVIADLIVHKEGQAVSDGGFSLISKIKAQGIKLGITTPVIAISGSVNNYGMEYMLVLAKNLGAHAVLAKPFAPERLIEKINELLK